MFADFVDCILRVLGLGAVGVFRVCYCGWFCLIWIWMSCVWVLAGWFRGICALCLVCFIFGFGRVLWFWFRSCFVVLVFYWFGVLCLQTGLDWLCSGVGLVRVFEVLYLSLLRSGFD